MNTFPVALLCDHGCEEIAALEVRELIKHTAVPAKGYVIIDDCSLTDAAMLCYRSQCASRVLALVQQGVMVEINDLDKPGSYLDFSYDRSLRQGDTFKVTCEREGDHAFQAHDAEEHLGGRLHDERGFGVNLSKPAMTLFCQIVDEAYVIGVDLSGRDLGKREHKVFHTRRSLRSTIAYAAVRAAGYTGKETLVNPFSTDGAFEVEAAIFATKASPQRFRKEFALRAMPLATGIDWDGLFKNSDERASGEPHILGFSAMRTLKMARANAKLAGVEKSLTLTACEISWLDTKLEPKSIDLIVTQPPASGKNTPLKDVEKLQDDLFKQAKLLLKKKGSVLLVAEKKAEFQNAAQRHGFFLTAEQPVHMGGSALTFLTFRS